MKYVFKVSMLLMCLSPLCGMDTDDDYVFITYDGHTDDLVTRADKAFNKIKHAYGLSLRDQEVPNEWVDVVTSGHDALAQQGADELSLAMTHGCKAAYAFAAQSFMLFPNQPAITAALSAHVHGASSVIPPEQVPNVSDRLAMHLLNKGGTIKGMSERDRALFLSHKQTILHAWTLAQKAEAECARIVAEREEALARENSMIETGPVPTVPPSVDVSRVPSPTPSTSTLAPMAALQASVDMSEVPSSGPSTPTPTRSLTPFAGDNSMLKQAPVRELTIDERAQLAFEKLKTKERYAEGVHEMVRAIEQGSLTAYVLAARPALTFGYSHRNQVGDCNMYSIVKLLVPDFDNRRKAAEARGGEVLKTNQVSPYSLFRDGFETLGFFLLIEGGKKAAMGGPAEQEEFNKQKDEILKDWENASRERSEVYFPEAPRRTYVLAKLAQSGNHEAKTTDAVYKQALDRLLKAPAAQDTAEVDRLTTELKQKLEYELQVKKDWMIKWVNESIGAAA